MPGAAARWRAGASRLPPQRIQRRPSEKGKERKRESGDGGSFAQRAAWNGALIGEGDEQVGGVGRTTARDGPDELEVGEGEDGREDGEDGGERQEQQPGDLPESPPAARSVDGGRLVQLLRNGLQSCEIADGEEGDSPPDVRDHQRRPGEPGASEEVHVLVENTQPDPPPAEEAELRVEDPPPG